MKTIMYILEDSRFGGMAKMISDLSKQNNLSLHRSKLLIASQNSLHLISYLNSQKISFDVLKIHHLSRNWKDILLFIMYFLSDILRMIIAIKQESPDIVYCNGSQHIKGIIAGRILGKKVIWHMHDTYQPTPIIKLFNLIRFTFRIKYFAASSKRTITYYKLPPKNTLLTIPPVDVKKFKNIKQNHNLNKNTINVISICNINPDKGIDILIETASKVNRVRSDVKFQVAGLIPETQTKLFESLLSLISKLEVQNIEFLGQRNDIVELLSDSEIYLCCSNNESGPIAVFEAMAMGLPIVTTDVGDLREIFALNNSGKVHPVKDSTSLANEIIYLLENPKLRYDLGRKGRTTAQNYLDINHSKLRHQNFYTKILADK